MQQKWYIAKMSVAEEDPRKLRNRTERFMEYGEHAIAGKLFS